MQKKLKIVSSKPKQEEWEELVFDDFNTMRSMLNSIQENIKVLSKIRQREFYKPFLYMLVEAHSDSVNPEIMKQVEENGMK